jgi:hypothetical protein
MAATIVVRAAVHPFFTLFLGLNQAARWGMGEIFRHGFIIVSVIILVFGPLLIIKWGSWGGCLTVLAASLIFAGYLTWRMQGIVTYSLQKWASAIALGLPFLSLLWWQSSWIVNVGLYSIFLIGYCSLLLFLRIIPPEELKTVWQAIDPRRHISDLNVQER